MPLNLTESRALFLKKAFEIRTQMHFDAIMNLFPEDQRAEIYAEVQPLLRSPFVFPNPQPPPDA